MLRYQQSVFPISSHPTLLKEWKSVADDYRADIQDSTEMEEPDKDSMNIVHDIFLEGLSMFLQKASNLSWSRRSPQEKREHVLHLLQTPQTEQRTQAWYEQAQQVLTASEFGNLYGSERQYASLVLSKAGTLPVDSSHPSYRLACRTVECSALDWGIRFEPVIKQMLERKWAMKILDSGRFIHTRDPKLAASPDGFILEGPDEQVGRLIEIKCPLSRKIAQGVPFDYWCQMQIQMEVTDIDECFYIEVKIASPHAKQSEYIRPENPFIEGHIWLLSKDVLMRYAYTEEERERYILEGFELLETIPWAVESHWIEIVSREKAWYDSTKQLREDFWKNVEKAKAGTFQVPEPTKKSKQKGCLIVDSPPAEVN